MNRKRLTTTFALVLLSAVTCFAQQEGGPGAGPGGQGGQGGPPPDFNPQAMRQRMMDRIRERLGASADEWKVLSPKIEKIMTTQRDLRGGGGGPGGLGGGGGFGGGPPPQGQVQGQGQSGPRGDSGDRGPHPARGGSGDQAGGRGGPPQEGGGPGGGPPPQDQSQQQLSTVAQARQNLREAVDDSNVNAEELAKLVKTYRDARDQAKDNLTKAQKELKELVTPRQEAFFVSMGLFD